MNILKKLWRAEPVVAGILGNVAFWPSLFTILAATGHPVNDPTQHAIVTGSMILTGAAMRQTVTAPDTLAEQIGTIQSVNTKAGV